MNKQLLITFTGLLFTLCLFGQEGPKHHHAPRQPHPLQFIDRLSAELELTDIQIQQLQDLRDSLKNQEWTPEMRTAEAMKAHKELIDAELAKILTPEQLVTLESKRQTLQKHKDSGQFKAMREEMDDYRKTEILPVFLDLRRQLEEKIDPADKATIQDLRLQMAAFRQKGDNGQEIQRGKKFRGERPEPSEAQKAAIETLKGLVEKYKTDIETLMGTVEKSQKEAWHEDIKTIHEKYFPDDEILEHNRLKGNHGEKKLKHLDKAPEGSLFKKGHFLLLDPNKDPIEEIQDSEQENNSLELSIFPNPSSTANRINYSISEAGKVKIELRKENGNFIKTLVDQNLEAGEYSLDLQVSDLESGVYYITITDGKTIKKTQKMVVSK